MMNSSQYFTLAAYADSGNLKYLYFLVVLCLYVVIIGSNVLLIVVICVNRSLHEPMYMFLCSLFVNELYGSTGLFPFLLLQILSDVHTIPASCCFLQIFIVYSYGTIEFFSLTVMSYDRYLAICFPLQYNTLMTMNKVLLLIVLVWFLTFLVNFCALSLIVPLKLCGNVINKVYCDNHSVVKLSCSDTTVHNVYGLSVTVFAVFVPLLIILFTYGRILAVCFSGCKQTKQKAVSTCSPHLASLINFFFGATFEILQSRFNMSNVPNMMRVFLSLYFLTCPPLFNPVMYGLKQSNIRNACRNLMAKVLV